MQRVRRGRVVERDGTDICGNVTYDTNLVPVPMKYLADLELPPVHPVGPIVRLSKVGATSTTSTSSSTEILDRLDDQRDSSVVILCFGSIGTFGKDQLKQIVVAQENGWNRFLWLLKHPLLKDKVKITDDYASFDGNPPEGFLEWMAKVWRVIGWAPQEEILSHSSVGGVHVALRVELCAWSMLSG